jgi:hypothetical protein
VKMFSIPYCKTDVNYKFLTHVTISSGRTDDVHRDI